MQVTRGYGLMEGFLAKRRASMANNLIPAHLRTDRILDIGCGSIPFFLINTAFQEKYGLDQGILNSTKEQYNREQNIHLIDFDIERSTRLPFDDGYFGVVTMLAVIEHVTISRAPALINEIRRVLKNGGIYIVTTPAPWTDTLLRMMAFVKLVSSQEIDDHKAAYDSKTLRSTIHKGGFETKNIESGYFEGFVNVWATAGKG
ncbi:MAG TPA: class I SAM-dependent methyltransferase [Syntrophorhabdaceae bacterium]|nr:class I SAM-dependent methyltransferase [Syntrophorhabdaceae bacterium]